MCVMYDRTTTAVQPFKYKKQMGQLFGSTFALRLQAAAKGVCKSSMHGQLVSAVQVSAEKYMDVYMGVYMILFMSAYVSCTFE